MDNKIGFSLNFGGADWEIHSFVKDSSLILELELPYIAFVLSLLLLYRFFWTAALQILGASFFLLLFQNTFRAHLFHDSNTSAKALRKSL
jgi:uncharacterized membrane protein